MFSGLYSAFFLKMGNRFIKVYTYVSDWTGYKRPPYRYIGLFKPSLPVKIQHSMFQHTLLSAVWWFRAPSIQLQISIWKLNFLRRVLCSAFSVLLYSISPLFPSFALVCFALHGHSAILNSLHLRSLMYRIINHSINLSNKKKIKII